MKTVKIEKRFEFGQNWLNFIQKNYSQDKVEISKNHILKFIKHEHLKGLTFLDIGCGSGLHSVAALQAGASLVHGFDYDQNSLTASRFIQNKVGNPRNWTIEQGSVLDDTFIAQMPQYDMVYSWGVLHHTGNVWHAIKNASSRVKPEGLFYISLYSEDVQTNPQFWLDVKRKYVSSGWMMRRLMDLWYILRYELRYNVRNLSAFIKKVIDYKTKRGMSIFTDIRDWLGGWPMEFVHDADAIKFCEGLGFRLENIKTGEACTEFLFIRERASPTP